MSRDLFFQGVIETGAQLLSAKGGSATLELELRFSNHEALLVFQEYCANTHINLEVGTIYNPTRPETGLWIGLSPAAGNAGTRSGYYSTPRTTLTQDLAVEFNSSD